MLRIKTRISELLRRRDAEAEAAELQEAGEFFVEHYSEPKQRNRPLDKQRAPSQNK